MSKKILIFGDLEDIISVKEDLLLILWTKIDTINDEIGEIEDCSSFNEWGNKGCRGCKLEKNCKKISNRFYADMEIEKINQEIYGIFSELRFLWREKEFRDNLKH